MQMNPITGGPCLKAPPSNIVVGEATKNGNRYFQYISTFTQNCTDFFKNNSIKATVVAHPLWTIAFVATGATLLLMLWRSQTKTTSSSPLPSQTGPGDSATIPANAPQTFSTIDSMTLKSVDKIRHRQDFMAAAKKGQWPKQTVVLAKSNAIVNDAMALHLMQNKKSSALGIKYRNGDIITNMEGACHTFLTPVCPITMLGIYAWKGHHDIDLFKCAPNGQSQGAQFVLSAAVQPDFEYDNVVMKIVEITNTAVEGKPLPQTARPLWAQVNKNQTQFKSQLETYEAQLQSHLVYHLTADHRLPTLSEIQNDKILNSRSAVDALETQIKRGTTAHSLKGLYVNLNKHVLSLEALCSIYIEQVRNEFTALETLLPQGYAYTIDPPSIFLKKVGGAANGAIFNRLQAMALQKLHQEKPLTNLKYIGFNDFADKDAVAMLQMALPGKTILTKAELSANKYKMVSKGVAIVLHNNSDGFGQNIETEGPSSMDGIIGNYSDAAVQLSRARTDFVIS